MAQRVKSNVIKEFSGNIREFEASFRSTFKIRSVDYSLKM